MKEVKTLICVGGQWKTTTSIIQAFNELEETKTRLKKVEELLDIYRTHHQQQMPQHAYLRKLELEEELK